MRWLIVCLFQLGTLQASAAADVEVLAPGRGITEGTIFVGRTLYFVDYSSSDVLRLDGHNANIVWHQDGCGATGLLRVPQGLLVACYDGNAVVLISLRGKILQTIRVDAAGRPFKGPNDLAADQRGGAYFSASGSEEVPGKVYYRAAGGQAREVATNLNYANGLVVTPDGGTLYVAETFLHRLLAFDIGADGGLGPPREFVKLSDTLAPGREYLPDGVRIDRHGRVYVGLYGGGGFAVIGSDARLIRQVDIPGDRHANLAISPDGRFVYGTTVRDGPAGPRGELYRTANPLAE